MRSLYLQMQVFAMEFQCKAGRHLLHQRIQLHRLTFQLFAQAPPFAHLAAVYRSFGWDGPLAFVKDAADLSDKVTGGQTLSVEDKAIESWFASENAAQTTRAAAE